MSQLDPIAERKSDHANHTQCLPVLPLLFVRAFKVSFFNPFRRAQAENATGAITVQVKWGRERFNIPIPNPSLTPLSTLIATLSAQTSLPSTQLKLIHQGAVLKDTSLTLSAYGITDGSVLVLVGQGGDVLGGPSTSSTNGTTASSAVPVKKKNKQPETTDETVLVEWISSLVSNLLGPLQPSILTFLSQTDPTATNRPARPAPFANLQKEHARLSEMLLRGLLDLDGIDIPSGWTDARKERKEGVRKVQNELTKVDEAWGERKKLGN